MSNLVQARQGITDHELEVSLRKRGWKGNYLPGNEFSPLVSYLTPEGKVIAKVYYDNQKCLKKAIFLYPPRAHDERQRG